MPPSTFPTAPDNLPANHADNVGEVIHADTINSLESAVNAIEGDVSQTPGPNKIPEEDASGNLVLIAFDKGGAVFNVKAYGAKGDGSTDDRIAIQAAITAASAVRGTVFFPPGLYMVSPITPGGYCLTMESDWVSLVGSGGLNFSTIIRATSGSSFTAILSVGVSSNRVVQSPKIQGICFQPSDGSLAYGTATGMAIDLRGTTVRMQDVTAQYCGGAAFIKFTMGASTQHSFDNRFVDCYLYIPLTDTTDGVYIAGGTGTITDTFFTRFESDGIQPNGTTKGGQYAFNLADTNVVGYDFRDCHPFFWKNAGYMLNGCGMVTISGGQIESCGSPTGNGGINSVTAHDITVDHVKFYGNWGCDIQVNWQAVDWVIDHNIFQGNQNSLDAAVQDAVPTPYFGLTRNIYVSSGAPSPSSRILIQGNKCFKGNIVTGFVANVQLDSGTSDCRVLSNEFDVALTETGTTTGSRNNVFDEWNSGPAASISTVDSSTVVGTNTPVPSPVKALGTVSTSPLSINATQGRIQTLTPGASLTLNAVTAPAGTELTLIIITSGTTSRTLTFGTNFKSTATLATGTTSAKTFVMHFISDGTNLLETSRTAAE